MKHCVILVLLLFMHAAYSEEQTQPPARGDTTPEVEEDSVRSEPGTREPELPGNPDSQGLRNRALSDAFRNFRPSEEISADNAVTFPVDI